jgi:hypothetical protein
MVCTRFRYSRKEKRIMKGFHSSTNAVLVTELVEMTRECVDNLQDYVSAFTRALPETRSWDFAAPGMSLARVRDDFEQALLVSESQACFRLQPNLLAAIRRWESLLETPEDHDMYAHVQYSVDEWMRAMMAHMYARIRTFVCAGKPRPKRIVVVVERILRGIVYA